MTKQDIYRIINRFKNVLNVQKDLQAEQMSMTFTEHDLKEIVYALGYMVAIMNTNEVEHL